MIWNMFFTYSFGIALVILSLCVLIDKLHSNNQEMHMEAKDKKIEICSAKKQTPKHKK